MIFAEKVQKARRKLFISQAALAKKLGVTSATINRWELGRTQPSFLGQKAFAEFCYKHKITFEE